MKITITLCSTCTSAVGHVPDDLFQVLAPLLSLGLLDPPLNPPAQRTSRARVGRPSFRRRSGLAMAELSSILSIMRDVFDFKVPVFWADGGAGLVERHLCQF